MQVLSEPCSINITRYISAEGLSVQLQITKLNQQLFEAGTRFTYLSKDSSLPYETRRQYLTSAVASWESLNKRYLSTLQNEILTSELGIIKASLNQLLLTNPNNSTEAVTVPRIERVIAKTEESQRELQISTERELLVIQYSPTPPHTIETTTDMLTALNQRVVLPENSGFLENLKEDINALKRNVWQEMLIEESDRFADFRNPEYFISAATSWHTNFERFILEYPNDQTDALESSQLKIAKLIPEAEKTSNIFTQGENCNPSLSIEFPTTEVDVSSQKKQNETVLNFEGIRTDIQARNIDDILGITIDEVSMSILLNSERISTRTIYPSVFLSNPSKIQTNFQIHFISSNDDSILFDKFNSCLARLSEKAHECRIDIEARIKGHSRFSCEVQKAFRASSVTYFSEHSRSNYVIKKR